MRYRTSGDSSGVIPVTVVNDAPSCIAYYLAPGTRHKFAVDDVHAAGMSARERVGVGDRQWSITDGVWHSNARLYLIIRGATHAFSAFWRASDWSFGDWYVDLQAPLQRYRRGFESEDYLLDVVVVPDGSWNWKDRDELNSAQIAGRFSLADVLAIRLEAERDIDRIEACSLPSNVGWGHWCPDQSWLLSTIPTDWNLID